MENINSILYDFFDLIEEELNKLGYSLEYDGDDDYKFISISKMVNKITEFNTEGLNFISVDYRTNKTFR